MKSRWWLMKRSQNTILFKLLKFLNWVYWIKHRNLVVDSDLSNLVKFKQFLLWFMGNFLNGKKTMNVMKYVHYFQTSKMEIWNVSIVKILVFWILWLTSVWITVLLDLKIFMEFVISVQLLNAKNYRKSFSKFLKMDLINSK